jgi:hypothetical protein
MTTLLMNRIQLTPEEIQVLADGLDGLSYEDANIREHAGSAARKLFKQAERFDPALTEHLIKTYCFTALLAGKQS